MIEILKKIYIKIEKQQNYIFKYSKQEQKKILEEFDEPKDGIERSYFQYSCQIRLMNKFILGIVNLISLFLIIIYLIKKSNVSEKINIVDAVFLLNSNLDKIVPTELKKEFKNYLYLQNNNENFEKKDKEFFKRLFKRYPFSWYFLLKCLIKLRNYSYCIKNNKTKAIVVCNEYSFTSSLLTEYCNLYNIEHINVMHGEKLFYIRDAFFKFNRCYVWDQYYIKLFFSLKADNKQFKIYDSNSLKIISATEIVKSVDYTYYLGGETKKELLNILKNMLKLKSNGYKILIRPHPLYSNLKEIRDIFKDFEIDQLPIETSILQTKNIISLYSTVLNQACNSKIPIIKRFRLHNVTKKT